jgi:hypothetical protein
MATTSPLVNVVSAEAQSRNACARAWGFSIAKVRPRVSCEGIPFGRSRNVRNHASLALPKYSIPTKELAPQITAHTDSTKMLESG